MRYVGKANALWQRFKKDQDGLVPAIVVDGEKGRLDAGIYGYEALDLTLSRASCIILPKSRAPLEKGETSDTPSGHRLQNRL